MEHPRHLIQNSLLLNYTKLSALFLEINLLLILYYCSICMYGRFMGKIEAPCYAVAPAGMPAFRRLCLHMHGAFAATKHAVTWRTTAVPVRVGGHFGKSKSTVEVS